MRIADILLAGFLASFPSPTPTSVAPATCEATARCSCVAVTDIRAHRDDMSDVFVGTAVAQRDTFFTPVPPGGKWTSSHAIMSFVVRQRWKGAPTDTVQVRFAKGDGANCGLTFRGGERYLVFARRDRGVLTTNACLQTNLEALSSRNLRALGRPMRPRRR